LDKPGVRTLLQRGIKDHRAGQRAAKAARARDNLDRLCNDGEGFVTGDSLEYGLPLLFDFVFGAPDTPGALSELIIAGS
jgi:hypothetical protein